MTEPKTISELMTLVMEESKKGNTKNAIIYLNEAIEIEPNDARFYISRGTFRGTENYEDAIEDYTKAIEIEPDRIFTHFPNDLNDDLYLDTFPPIKEPNSIPKGPPKEKPIIPPIKLPQIDI